MQRQHEGELMIRRPNLTVQVIVRSARHGRGTEAVRDLRLALAGNGKYVEVAPSNRHQPVAAQGSTRTGTKDTKYPQFIGGTRVK